MEYRAPGRENGMSRQGRTGYGEIRFTPNSFQYNGRVAAAMVPCAIFLLGIGGKPVLATLTSGSCSPTYSTH